MELKRKWQSFYHRLAQWRSHKSSQLTGGVNHRAEIFKLVENAEKEISIVDFAEEPIFSDEEFIALLFSCLSMKSGLVIQILLFPGEKGISLLDDIAKNYRQILIHQFRHTPDATFSLYLLEEEPYLLFYLSEKEVLLKDVIEAEGKPISLKFQGENAFQKDCLEYLQYLLKTPGLSRIVLQFPLDDDVFSWQEIPDALL